MNCELEESAFKQLCFEGLEPQNPRRINPRFHSKLLILLRPPPVLADGICSDASRHAAQHTSREAYPAELLHITLVCLGGFDAVPRGLINRVTAVLREVRARPVPVTLDGSSLFGNRKSLALNSSKPMPEIDALAKMIQRALKRDNLPYIRTSLTPHMTTIYGCGKIEPMPVGKPYSWLAGNFELVFSHNGETRHEHLARFPLSAKANPYELPESQMHLPERIICAGNRFLKRKAA